MGPVEQYVLDKHYFRKHGQDAYYGQTESPITIAFDHAFTSRNRTRDPNAMPSTSKHFEVWFVTGSQHLYGDGDAHARSAAIRRRSPRALDAAGRCRCGSSSSRC